MTRSRLVLAVVVAAATAGAVAFGVRAGDDAPHAEPSPSTTPTAANTPTTPDEPPRMGSCHRLSFRGATAPTDPTDAVPCRSAHTAVTIHVGRLDPVVDGHLLAIDSAAIQDQLAKRCPPRLAAYVGGDRTARRLSRLTVVWFGPTVAESDRGARWYRCDVVALAGHDELAPLARRMRGVLDRPGALDRWGTCGTAAPDARTFERVICAQPHRWRAVDVIGLPAAARFLGRKAGAAANDACKAVASGRAGGALTYSWSFEWPTRDQWTDGQRYGYCWVPAR
jgi:hypothetical protein